MIPLKPKKKNPTGPKTPFFTVILPLHHHQSYFRESLRSILKQDFPDYEVLAVGDGFGKPGKSLPADPKIRMIPQKGTDVSTARNLGVLAARGEFTAFLDPGDQWEPDYLSSIKKLIEDFPGAGFYGANYRMDDGITRRENPLRLPPGWRGRLKNFYGLMYYGRPPFCASSVVLPCGLARQNPFPEGILAGEELLVWFKISLKHDMAYLKKSRTIYRMKAFENKQGRYFGPLKHMDWLAFGKRLKEDGQLSREGEKFTVWVTLLQVRKMLDNGRKEQALVLWKRCPKNIFIPYQAYLWCLVFLSPVVWKILQPGVKIARWMLTGGVFSRRAS